MLLVESFSEVSDIFVSEFYMIESIKTGTYMQNHIK